VPVAAGLSGLPVAQAHEHLTALVDAHLLEPVDGQHYAMHELLRLFAAEQVAQQTPAATVRRRPRTVRFVRPPSRRLTST
jgi:hypothetical protein